MVQTNGGDTMTGLKWRFRSLLLTAALACGALWQPAAAAEDMTDICLKNGILLRARIDTRDGKFFVYVPGKDTATDMTGQIHSVGVPEDPVCKTGAPSAAAATEGRNVRIWRSRVEYDWRTADANADRSLCGEGVWRPARLQES